MNANPHSPAPNDPRPQENTDRNAAARYLDLVYRNEEGYAVLATLDRTKPKGRDWSELFFKWPEQREEYLDTAMKLAPTREIYVTPVLRSEQRRTQDTSLPGLVVWADIDGKAKPGAAQWFRERGGVLVASGSPNSYHGYLRFQKTQPPEVIKNLNYRIKELLGADHKHSTDSVLRLPGTFNHKTSPPVPVVFANDPSDHLWWTPDEVAAELPEPGQEDAPPEITETAPEPLPRLPRYLRTMRAEQPHDGKMSDQVAALVWAGVEQGLTDGQLVTLAMKHAPSIEKYGGRIGKEVARLATKHRLQHDHTGQPCDKAGCPNKPEWMGESTPDPESDIAIEGMLAELLDSGGLDSIPDPEWLIEGWLELNTISRINGKPGHGKSFITLDMAGHIGSGMPWCGNDVKQGLVVYLVAEGATGIKRRVRAWEKHHKRRMENVRFLPRPVQATGIEWYTLIAVCRRLKPVLIVIDTQARVTVGLEENSAKEMGEFVDMAERLREATKACVEFVHHLGHNGDHGRGSSAILGAMSTEIKVEKKGRRYILSNTKQKESAEADELTFFLKQVPLGDDARGKPVMSAVMVRMSAEEIAKAKESERGTKNELLDKLEELGPSTPQELAEALGKTREAIANALGRQAKKDKPTVRKTGEKRGSADLWERVPD